VFLKGTNGLGGQVLGCDVDVSILKPTGVAGTACMESSGFIDATSLPAAATYTVLVDPVGTATGSVTLTLYDVPPDITGPIVPGGAAVPLAFATPGQNAVLTFAAAAGQRVSLVGTNGMTGQIAFTCDVDVTIRNPDGTAVAAPTCMEGTGFTGAVTLPVAGIYSILANPTSWATGSLTLNLYTVPADVSGPIVVGGPSVTVTTTAPSQNAVLTFTGTALQRVSLRGTNGMSGQIAFACDVEVTMKKPDGTALNVPAACMEGSGFIDVTTLPTSGTYSILVDPVGTVTGSLTLTLYDVPADVTGTIAPGGAPVTVTMTAPGQNAVLTFAGTALQRVSLLGTNGLSGQVGLTCDVGVTIKKPDGSLLTPTSTCMESSGFLDVTDLPVAGTYSILVNPDTYAVGSLTLTLYDVPADVTGSVAINGASVPVSLLVPGQKAILTFTGAASQSVRTTATVTSGAWRSGRALPPSATA
jgi:hypothetical protein